MVDFPLKSEVDRIQTIEPDIMSCFVFSLSPNVFLLIESRLIRRKILYVNLAMFLKKKPDFFPFMPFSPIYIEKDSITTEAY